jgi:hypothetical protein
MKSSLACADLDYHEADIDLKIQHHVKSYKEPSIVLLVGFIMAIDMGSFIFESVYRISHQVCTECTHHNVLVPIQFSQPEKKDHWFKKVFTRKSIPLPKLRNDK